MGHGRPTYVIHVPDGQRESASTANQLHVLQLPGGGGGFTPGGGDESKKQWFIRIAGLNESEYLWPNPDDFNLTPAGLNTRLRADAALLVRGVLRPRELIGDGHPQLLARLEHGRTPLQLFSSPQRHPIGWRDFSVPDRIPLLQPGYPASVRLRRGLLLHRADLQGVVRFTALTVPVYKIPASA